MAGTRSENPRKVIIVKVKCIGGGALGAVPLFLKMLCQNVNRVIRRKFQIGAVIDIKATNKNEGYQVWFQAYMDEIAKNMDFFISATRPA